MTSTPRTWHQFLFGAVAAAVCLAGIMAGTSCVPLGPTPTPTATPSPTESPTPTPTASPSPTPFVDPYENVLRDNFSHDLAAGGHFGQDCSACHHSDPSAAAKSCTDCHDRDEALFSEEFEVVVPKLKDAMHAGTLDSGKGGCQSCHSVESGVATEDGLWDCTFCHQALNDL